MSIEADLIEQAWQDFSNVGAGFWAAVQPLAAALAAIAEVCDAPVLGTLSDGREYVHAVVGIRRLIDALLTKEMQPPSEQATEPTTGLVLGADGEAWIRWDKNDMWSSLAKPRRWRGRDVRTPLVAAKVVPADTVTVSRDDLDTMLCDCAGNRSIPLTNGSYKRLRAALASGGDGDE